MCRRRPGATQGWSSAASEVNKRQEAGGGEEHGSRQSLYLTREPGAVSETDDAGEVDTGRRGCVNIFAKRNWKPILLSEPDDAGEVDTGRRGCVNIFAKRNWKPILLSCVTSRCCTKHCSTTGQVSAASAILPACLTSNERGCALNKIALASTFV